MHVHRIGFVPMMTLVQNLKARAKKLGLADAEVARRAGVAERTYANYTIGKRSPDFMTFVRICEVLNSTPNELFGVEKTASGVVVTKSMRWQSSELGSSSPSG